MIRAILSAILYILYRQWGNKMKLWRLVASMLMAMLLLLCGCGLDDDALEQTKPYLSKSERYYGMRDANGNLIKNIPQPKRIVSLCLRSDEILMELVGPESICSLSKWVDDPVISNITNEAKLVKGRSVPAEEYILSQRPDFVITNQSQSPDMIQRLRSIGIPVYVCKTAKTIEDTKTLILDLGKLLKREEKAQSMVAEMDTVLADVAAKIALIPDDKRVVVYRFSVSGGSGGKGTYYDDYCKHAGVINAAAKMRLWGTQLMPKEQIVNANPDVVFLPTWDYTGKINLDYYVDEIARDPAMQTVSAIKNKRMYLIPDKHMLDSSQYMVKCVEDIYDACYGNAKPVKF